MSIIKTPHLIHYAKEVDNNGKFIRWISSPNPEGIRKQSSKFSIEQIYKSHNFKKPFCFFCGRTKKELGDKETLTIDHIIPIREDQGEDIIENVQILCSACHKLRHWTELYMNKHLKKFFEGGYND